MATSPADAPARPGFGRFVQASAVLAIAAGVALRAGSTSDLWLDEALSVHIAALPVGDLLDALRADGHPPLYYLVLHGWIALFGDGDEAVRSLSGVLSVLTLPLAWIAGVRYGGRTVALAAVVLLATNPFAVRYATEARMYALVMALVLLGWLCVRRALHDGSRLALAGTTLTSGLLLLTHYWSFYLLAATGVLLVWLARRGVARARPVIVAVAAGGLLFLPWLVAFLDQAGSTGTPWGRPARPTSVVTISLTDWGGGTLNGLNGEAQLLGLGLALLVLPAVFARPLDGRRLELDVRTQAHVRPEIVVVLLTMGLAVLAGYATSSAFASRYTATVFPIVVLVAAYGAARLPTPAIQAGAVAALALLGLVGGVDNLRTQRTQGGEIARYVADNGVPGDVVAFCPDQLGPAVARVLPDGFDAVTFPEADPPLRVDWVDYEERMRAGDPAAFAELLHERAGDATVWLVWSGGYRTLDERCETVADVLRRLRPGGTAVVASGEEFEHAWLYQYGPVP